MTQELTDYEIQKAKHKRLLVRNEMKTTGKYQIPIIAKQKIDFDEISLLSYVNTKTHGITMLKKSRQDFSSWRLFCSRIIAKNWLNSRLF